MVRILMVLSVVAPAAGCGHGGARGVDASADARDSAADDAGVDVGADSSADLAPDQAPEADTPTGKECPASPVITEFPAGGATDLMGIARGPDGNVWFTDSGKNAVGVIGRLVP